MMATPRISRNAKRSTSMNDRQQVHVRIRALQQRTSEWVRHLIDTIQCWTARLDLMEKTEAWIALETRKILLKLTMSHFHILIVLVRVLRCFIRRIVSLIFHNSICHVRYRKSLSNNYQWSSRSTGSSVKTSRKCSERHQTVQHLHNSTNISNDKNRFILFDRSTKELNSVRRNLTTAQSLRVSKKWFFLIRFSSMVEDLIFFLLSSLLKTPSNPNLHDMNAMIDEIERVLHHIAQRIKQVKLFVFKQFSSSKE